MSVAVDRLTTEDVWQEVGVGLRAFVRRRIADPDDAEDVVGDVLLRIHEHIGGLGSREKVTSWVYRIARNAIIDHYRRTARRFERLEAEPVSDTAADSWIDDQDAATSDLAGCIRPLLQALPADYRRALELTELEGHTQAEAARAEGISISGMKSRVQRGRRQFASLVKRCCHVLLDRRGRVIDYQVGADGSCCDSCTGD